MTELKPCPFCGKEPHAVFGGEDIVNGYVTVKNYDPATTICCQNQDCAVSVTYLGVDSKAKAIAAWNTRPVPPPQDIEKDAEIEQKARTVAKELAGSWDFTSEQANDITEEVAAAMRELIGRKP